MECVTEDTSSVELFCREFNNAYRDANNTNERFNPVGWITDILENIKGCKFHYQKSLNDKTRNLRKYGSQFKTMALELLESGTKEAYQFAHEQMLRFIKENDLDEVVGSWLKWWHERRFNIFRPFTGFDCPRMNQAEVIHASIANRNDVGVPILTSTEFDVRDGVFFESQLEQFLESPNSV